MADEINQVQPEVTATATPAASSVTAVPAVNKPKKGEDVSIRYRGLSYEMAVELQLYEDEYFAWDLPVPFGEKLKIYPVGVRKYNRFMDAVSCFLLDKKQFSPQAKPEDIKKQLKMTDLEYMISKMDTVEWGNRLVTLIELVFHVSHGMKCPHCGRVMSYQEYKDAATKLFQEIVAKAQQSKMKEEASLVEPTEVQEPTEITEEEVELPKGEVSDSSEVEEGEEGTDDDEATVEADENEKIEEKVDEEQSDKTGESKENETPTIKCPECGGDGLYESIRYGENEQTHKMELFIDGQKIDFRDFTRLKNIVLFQNMPDYRDTSYIDPSLKKDYETQRRIKSQQHGNLTATLEEKLAAIKVFEGLPSYEPLYDLTIRKFLIEFGKMDDLITYQLQMMGRYCGLGGGPKDIPHWIYHEIKDVYADGGYISKDTMMEKTKNIAG